MFISVGQLFGILGIPILLAVAWFYQFQTMLKKYWPNRGIFFVDMNEVGGGRLKNLAKRVHSTAMDQNIYKFLKEKKQPFGGYMEFNKPTIFLRDLELARMILVKDFDHFMDRRNIGAGNDDFGGDMLVFMEGERWKELRAKMSPTFTTGKIRRMFGILDGSAKRLVNFLNAQLESLGSSTVDLLESYGKYTIDVISSAAFGLESGAFNGKKSLFEKNAARLQFKFTFLNTIKIILIFTTPRIAKFFKLSMLDEYGLEFFNHVIMKAIKHRRMTGEKRDDFLQLMLDVSAGQLKTEVSDLESDIFEKDAQVVGKGRPKTILTDHVICAQSILFFIAGYDMTKSTLLFAAYQLAISPEAQKALAEEVQASFNANGRKFTYESINEIEYMEKFVLEVLRMYPPGPRIERKCTKDYPIPGTDLRIPTGILVAISVYSIHHDESIYPDPYKFDPERFSKKAKAERSPYSYLPFGHGPRNCIGMRFAITEIKLALAHMVLNFKLEPCEETMIPIEFDNGRFLAPKDGMKLKLIPRVAK